MNQFKSFTAYVTEATKEVTFAWGRFNPPTIGHEKLLEATAKVARGSTYRIYATQTTDSKKNPLEYTTKVKYMRKMFPRHARSIVLDPKIKTMFDILTKLYDEGYTKVNLIAGSDRVPEYEALCSKYNGVKGRHGFYNFDGGVNIISAGERDPDADGATGMSASKLRAAAFENDFQIFSKGIPSGFKETKQLFNDIRTGMGLKESHDFRSHLQLQSVSETREAYVAGSLYGVDDEVIIKESGEVGRIINLGSNYVLVEMHDGRKMRKWLDAVEKLEEMSEGVDVISSADVRVTPSGRKVRAHAVRFKNSKPDDKDVEEDVGSVRHHLLQPNFKHAMQHSVIHKDIDVDGDVDVVDKSRPDEVVGAQPFDQGITTKKLQKAMDKEVKMAKKRVAFEHRSFSSFVGLKDKTK